MDFIEPIIGFFERTIPDIIAFKDANAKYFKLVLSIGLLVYALISYFYWEKLFTKTDLRIKILIHTITILVTLHAIIWPSEIRKCRVLLKDELGCRSAAEAGAESEKPKK